MFLVLQPGVDGHDALANANPGHYALERTKDTTHTLWSLSAPVQDNILLIWMT